MSKYNSVTDLIKANEKKQLESIPQLRQQIEALQAKNKELIEALKPFASFGPDVNALHDNQAFMGAAQLKAKPFKDAHALLVKFGVMKSTGK